MNLRDLLSMTKNVLEDPLSVHEEYCKSQQNKQNICKYGISATLKVKSSIFLSCEVQ